VKTDRRRTKMGITLAAAVSEYDTGQVLLFGEGGVNVWSLRRTSRWTTCLTSERASKSKNKSN
jgi:hypothetical protein